jgi:hypothetical protein
MVKVNYQKKTCTGLSLRQLNNCTNYNLQLNFGIKSFLLRKEVQSFLIKKAGMIGFLKINFRRNSPKTQILGKLFKKINMKQPNRFRNKNPNPYHNLFFLRSKNFYSESFYLISGFLTLFRPDFFFKSPKLNLLNTGKFFINHKNKSSVKLKTFNEGFFKKIIINKFFYFTKANFGFNELSFI